MPPVTPSIEDPSIEEQRNPRARRRAVSRATRALRERIGSLRRLLALTVVLALVGIGAAVYFAQQSAGEAQREAILLGRGQAGVLVKDTLSAATREAPRRPGRATATVQPDPQADTGEQGENAGTGEASYYGDELRGRPTASGESFNPEGYTAAHRTLPLGTRLRVTNLRNGESVIVRVNDRGPFSGDRVLDVSKGAARDLGMLGSGTARVRMELLPSVRG